MADLDGLAHIALQVALLVHDFHGASAQHIAGAYHQRVTERSGFFQGLGFSAGGGVGRLAQVERVQQFLKTLAVFGSVNHVGAGADDGHAVGFQIQRQLQGGLAAVLHDHAQRLFLVHDFQHVFQSQRFEIQPVRGVVVGRYGLRIAVDHMVSKPSSRRASAACTQQ